LFFKSKSLRKHVCLSMSAQRKRLALFVFVVTKINQ